MRAPRRPNRNTEWGQWACDLLDWLFDTKVQSSPTVKATQTTRGIFLEAAGKKGAGEGAALQFRGQYDPAETYAEDDIVICHSTTAPSPVNEMDDGRMAGTYIATTAIGPGGLRPGLTPQTALATAVLDGDEVDTITVDDGGAGYSTAPGVTISGGGGSGATATATLTDGSVSSIAVTNPGTGYTSAPTVTVDAPDQTQLWEDFAEGSWPKLTLRPTVQARTKQRIIFEAGRGAVLPLVQILTNVDDETVGSVTIDLADIPGGAGDKVIQIRETYACDQDTGETKLCLVVRSDYYAP